MKNHEYSMAKEVYESLWGGVIEECRIPWVEDATASGSHCMELYGQMRDAYDRLLLRLGRVDDDGDVEAIINALLDIQQELCLKMFKYGRIYEKTLL